MRLLSLGAGVQSTTLALMACDGTLPKVDGAIFADTGWEPKRVYEHLGKLSDVLNAAGVPLYVVSRGNLRRDVLDPHAHATIPAYVRGSNGERQVIGRRCTGRYKVEPIERQIRILLGASVRTRDCRYCAASGQRVAPWDVAAGLGPCSVCRGTGQRQIVGSVPAGAVAEQWIGFSTDEVHRVSSSGFPAYAEPRYPLLELGMSREDCQRWLRMRGWENVAKSACIGCPYSGNRQWRDLRDNRPDEWADAVAFDRAFRNGPGLNGQRFLHASRMPLDAAPIDHVTRTEWAKAQTDVFGQLADIDAELAPARAEELAPEFPAPAHSEYEPDPSDAMEFGDPDGCSPYGCRSGSAVAA